MSTTNTQPSAPTPRLCSDCGRQAWETAACFDRSTGAHVTLCPTCTLAFRQRQAFSPGCCGD